MATATKPRRHAVFMQKEYDYIACLDWEFGWKKDYHLPLLKVMWEEERLTVAEIARIFKRPKKEVWALLYDQYEQGKINDERLKRIFG